MIENPEYSDVNWKELFLNFVKEEGQFFDFGTESKIVPVSFDDLFIRNKDTDLIKFVPNNPQQMFLDHLLPNWKKGDLKMKGKREILLKARQEGFSTLIEALNFINTISYFRVNSVVIAHHKDSAEMIFEMVRTFLRYLKEEKRPGKPLYDSKNELYFPDIDSRFKVLTAGSRDIGRGGTPTNVHASEVAFWDNGASILSGLLKSVPPSGNIFLESTANGFGNFYQIEVEMARNKKSQFFLSFYPWFALEDYKITEEDCNEDKNGVKPRPSLIEMEHKNYEEGAKLDGREKEEEIEYEKSLIDNFGVSYEQLAWRRWERLGQGADIFPQEHPATIDEAFISSGNPYFDSKKLQSLSIMLQNDIYKPKDIGIPKEYKNLWTLRNSLELWDEPKENYHYIISADVAEGLDSVNRGKKPDFNSADVICIEDWEQVGHLHGLWDTHTYGLSLSELGYWFNTSLIAVERNNMGHATINTLMNFCMYPINLEGDYRHGLYMHTDYDRNTKITQRKAGWPTNEKTKKEMLENFIVCWEKGPLKINSKKTVSELLTFMKLPGGKAGGEVGKKDDCVISICLGASILRLAPLPSHAYNMFAGGEEKRVYSFYTGKHRNINGNNRQIRTNKRIRRHSEFRL